MDMTPQSTGDDRVDQAVAGLEALAGLPLDEHPAALEAVHDQLKEILGGLGDAGRPGAQGRTGEAGETGEPGMQGEQGELDRGEGGGDDIGRDPRR